MDSRRSKTWLPANTLLAPKTQTTRIVSASIASGELRESAVSRGALLILYIGS